MASTLTRSMLDAAFAPHELITVPDSVLGPVSDTDARDVLGTLGLPVWDNPWMDLDSKINEQLGTVADWGEDPADRYEHVPEGAAGWISLGVMPYDGAAFDPADGKVYCLPEDGEIYLLNSSLRSFVHFLYLLKTECPHIDLGDENCEWARCTGAEHEEIRLRIREAMSDVDPAALTNPESQWFKVLTYIVDPEASF
ncbi:SUKH-4 family immunity protein [Streptomyces sp. NBC_01465]|uniref:SUKH-4 family immunity protein n=1 Tax=Streptomyces sp. NBC_01465 TaxID=2903878 RepID=UPI002E36FFE2|nr:SUKH-4 family immunity protein [Streptomyces sp. NBC_01465]